MASIENAEWRTNNYAEIKKYSLMGIEYNLILRPSLMFKQQKTVAWMR